MRFFWIFIVPFFLFASIRSDLNVGLRALQQLRTLIPERLSDEEFSIVVDKKALAESLQDHSHPLKQTEIPSAISTGCNHFYYSRWTISGEPIRILDSYQEFEYGPYWLYPTSVQRMDDMHNETTTGSSK